MNNLTERLKNPLVAKAAIIYYASADSDHYLEFRKITHGKMGAGAPLDKTNLKLLVKCIKEEDNKVISFGGQLPHNLLFAETAGDGNYKLIWHLPVQQRMLHFIDALNIGEGLCMMPPLIFVSTNNGLSVFAYKSNKRPKDNTILYSPPFLNCSATGGVCLGSAKAKLPADNSYASLMHYWESLFFNSKFSHISNTAFKGNLNLTWKELIQNANQLFPVKNLVKTKFKFKDICTTKYTT